MKIVKRALDHRTVLFVTRTLGIGGAETQIYCLIRELIHAGYTPAVFALETNGPMRTRFKGLGVPVFTGGLLNGEIRKKPWKLLLAWLRLDRTIRRTRPAVIHAWLPLMTFMGAVSGRLRRVSKCLISRRALGTHQDRYPILKWLDLAAEALCHGVIVNSVAVKQDMIQRQRFFHDKIKVIHNGINLSFMGASAKEKQRAAIRRDLGIGPLETVVILVANLIPYKGHADLVDAAALLKREGRFLRYLLVGEDRGILKNLKHRVEKSGLQDAIGFLGVREDVHRLLAASDITVLPSHEEGFSNVILESMNAGRPVIATRVGGNPEAVIDGVTGWLVPPHSPDMLAEKIKDLLDHPEKARAWGAAGKARVKRWFGMDRMVESHMRVYEADRIF